MMTCGPSSTCWLSLSLDNYHGGKLKTKYELERINQYISHLGISQNQNFSY